MKALIMSDNKVNGRELQLPLKTVAIHFLDYHDQQNHFWQRNLPVERQVSSFILQYQPEKGLRYADNFGDVIDELCDEIRKLR